MNIRNKFPNGIKKYWEVFVIFIFSLTPLFWLKNNEIVIGHDSGFRLNYLDHLINLFYSWNSIQNFGTDWGILKGFLIIQAPETIFSLLFGSLTLGQLATFVMWFFVIGLSMYVLVRNFFYQKEFWIFRLFSSLFYMYNFFILQAWFIAERAKFSLIAALPLGILIIYKTLSKEHSLIKGVIAFSLLSFFLNGGGSPPLYGSLILTYLIIFLFLTLINVKNNGVKEIIFSIKTALALLIGFLAINSYFVIPHFYGILNKYYSVLYSIGGISGILAWENAINKFASFLNLLRLQGIPDWYDNPSHPYSNFFLENPLLIIASFFPILIILLGLLFHRRLDLQKRQDKIFYLIFLIFIVGLLFASGSHPPFGFIYVFLVEHLPGFAIFRSAFYKFGLVAWFSVIFLTGYYLNLLIMKYSKKNYVQSIIGVTAILFIILYHFPYFKINFFEFNNPFTTKVIIPTYVEETKNYMNDVKTTTRILILPKLDPGFKIDSYTWGFWSLESLPKLSLNHSTVTNDNVSPKIVGQVYKLLDRGDTLTAEKLLGSLGVNNIILRNDVVYNNKKTKIQDLRLEKNNFLKISSISPVKRFGEWEIYDLKTQNYLPIFYSPKNIVFSHSGIEFYPDFLSLEPDPRVSVVFSDDPENSLKNNNIKNIFNKLYIVPICVLCKDRELEIYKSAVILPKVNFLPGSPLYILKIEKEKLLINQSNNIPERIDLDISFSGNRLSELSGILFKESTEPNTKIILMEKLIKKYETLINDAMSHIENLSGIERNQYRIRLLAYLQIQRNFLNKLHFRENFSEKKYNTLATFMDNQISKIKNEVWMSIDTNKKRLLFTIEDSGFYNIEFLDSQPIPSRIVIDGNGIKDKKNIDLSQGEHRMEISYDQSQFILDQDSSEFLMKNNDKRVFNLSGVKSSESYILSFEYKILDGDNSLFETSYETSNQVASRLNLGRNVEWRSFSQEIEYSILDSEPKNIIFKNLSQETNSTLIRNLRITKSFIPSVYITRNLKNATYTPPILKIQKVNPTQYNVRIMNAKTPYILNFGESFDKGWKVYITDSSEEDSQFNTLSYFDGDIKENRPQRKVFDNNTLAAVFNPSISEENHFKTNGYSNAWYIEKTGDYNLVVFFEPQKYFYLGLVVTTSTLMGFSVVLIKKKYVKH